MGSATFPLAHIHATAAASCLLWSGVSLLVHLATAACWKGYRGLQRKERLQWCNKIACGLHGGILAACQARHLWDPALRSDPLHATNDVQFFYVSALAGYLLYDTLYSLLFFDLRAGAAFLVHHLVGLAGCAMYLYAHKLVLFGLAIQVLFEGCNPLLHVLNCMRLARATSGRLYRTLSVLFVAQYFLFRVVGGTWFLGRLVLALAALPPPRPWWGWVGAAGFGLLAGLNTWWFGKLCLLARREGAAAAGPKGGAADAGLAKTAAAAAAAEERAGCGGGVIGAHRPGTKLE